MFELQFSILLKVFTEQNLFHSPKHIRAPYPVLRVMQFNSSFLDWSFLVHNDT